MSAPPTIIEFTIKNFRGIASLAARPDGKSITLRGKNGAGKSSAIDAFWWGLGGSLDGEVVRNGEERAEVEITLGDYLVTRKQTKGKKPTLDVRSADGKARFTSPTQLLAGFIGAIERRTFSSMKGSERAAVLRRLAPGLDVSDLETERARIFEERTGINREAKQLRAQAEGVVVPAQTASPGEEKDLAAIAGKKAEIERARASNAAARTTAKQAAADHDRSLKHEAEAELRIEALDKQLEQARAALEAQRLQTQRLRQASGSVALLVAQLVDPDPAEVDREIAEAREHNARVRAGAETASAAARAIAERSRLAAAAEKREAAAKEITSRLEAIDAEKAARTAAADLPTPGIGLSGDAVTFDDGRAGPVEIEALNTATRIRLDVAIAAALGHRLVAVRDASLLDADGRAEVDRFAAERGVQLLAEVVASGEPLVAVIEEAVIDASQI